ncbi:MAG: hypothetical protein ACLRYR_10670 [Bifidobacterium dentium]
MGQRRRRVEVRSESRHLRDRDPARVGRGEPYAILHGPIVALGFDPDTCESVSLTDGQARAVIEYFTETSPAGSGLVESMRLGPGVLPFPDDRADTVPSCGM